MWDMMLVGGGPYGRRHKGGGHGGSKRHDLRCQAVSDEGIDCAKSVKDGDPERFRYCGDHGPSGGSRGYCRQHCWCDRARLVEEGSLFCEAHTCEAATCRAEVAGRGERGERGEAGGSCDDHRRCGRDGCEGRCHRRDTGAAARWCGLHYCHEPTCQGERAAGSRQHCRDHTCLEPLCGSGRLDMGAGRYCADHQCRTGGCLERRDQTTPAADHCAVHSCRVRHCARPAAAGSDRCEDHGYCREQGCREYVLVERGPQGDTIRHATCDQHHKPLCPASRCANRLDNNNSRGQAYCPLHSCELASCRNQRGLASLQYCDAHKCAVVPCQQLRRNPVPAMADADAPLRASLLLAAAAAAAPALLTSSSSYCAAHACSAPAGCADRVADLPTSSFCPRHECCRRACDREATRHPRASTSTSRAGYCDRHYRGRVPMAMGMGMPMGMPMAMPMGYPPYLGRQGRYGSDSGSDSDSAMGPAGLPFGGLPF
ncbi:hypothetical protein KVR01_008074 [Diaporthe batatas]|uniref:uncharacterized protein n=1 Tax=Diaporthe batatas TaxID=748121 RepID=UPI001D04E15B|nr:uncharacterized protein KVR01_008074 [Diaporthe batatas]KAG8162309.1 hypothetical protein KVR01_008074 [Diaporthe batatas]